MPSFQARLGEQPEHELAMQEERPGEGPEDPRRERIDPIKLERRQAVLCEPHHAGASWPGRKGAIAAG
jgi:hypothetical protein